MKAEIITIGDELLIGQTVDTNSAWIGAELSRLGFDIYKKTSIHDNRAHILEALDAACKKADLVLITGGLGPTSDDITKPTLCEFFGTRLVMNNEVLQMVEEMMNRRGFPMNENNRKQAEVPESCRVLKNATGTAPGMWFEKKDTIFISMPGVPFEMKYIMTEHVIPQLKHRFRSQVILHRNIMTYGMPEARLAERLEGFEKSLPPEIRLAYLPSAGIIKLRLTATARDINLINSIIEYQVRKLYEIIPDFIYGENEESMEMVIGKLLSEAGGSVCTAESCTGGRIAQMITSIPGSSGYFKGSVIAYDNQVKIRILDISGDLIDEFGAVSEQVVKQMAMNARSLLKTDFAVATSGIAGPGGGSETKPVGTLWIAVASEKETVTEKHVFGTDRINNIDRFSVAALNLLRKQILHK